MFPLP